MSAYRLQLPYFIPEDLALEQLPEGFRRAIEDIILPAYQELVIQASSALERAAGMTLCHDMWLELLEQFEIGRTMRETFPRGPLARVCMDVIEKYSGPFLPDNVSLERYSRLGARKEKVAKFLLQFRVARARWGAPIDGPSAPPPAAEPARQAVSDPHSANTSCRPRGSEVAGEASIESGDNLPRRRPR